MRVRCTTNRASRLPEMYLDPAGGYGPDTVFSLRPGKEYTVYALTLRTVGVWYYVLDRDDDEYPIWHPAALFDVTDPRISRYWIYGFVDDGLRDGDAVFAFPEWTRQPFEYYDQLTDGFPEPTAIFRRYRELMTLEFRDTTVEQTATVLDDEWLMCPICTEAWQDTGTGELVRCPDCRGLLVNPRLTQ